MDASISPTTRSLIDLLRRWPRKAIVEALAGHADPQHQLVSGSLAAALPAVGRDPTLKQSNKTRIAPGRAHDGALSPFDHEYPQMLKHIPDPPLVLYYRGNKKLLDKPAVAIVGARRSTTQGRTHAQLMARELTARGIIVVSGLALGIDGAAHRGALAGMEASSPKGNQHPAMTIAVLGGGLQQIYPRSHIQLAQRIVEDGGLLVSEYADAMPPLAHQFPERNRIISGLSMGTVVVEATLSSGSLITARCAAEQGRDVFAMPGPVSNAMSAGCHRLIQQGAGLVSSAEDVLLALGQEGVSASAEETPRAGALSSLDAEAQALVAKIQGYPVSLDELLSQTGYPVERLTNMLVKLELAGFVQQGPLGYSRAS